MGRRDHELQGLDGEQRLASVEPVSVVPLTAVAAARLGGARQKRLPSECNGERESRIHGHVYHSNRDNRPYGTAMSPKAYGLTAATLKRVVRTNRQ